MSQKRKLIKKEKVNPIVPNQLDTLTSAKSLRVEPPSREGSFMRASILVEQTQKYSYPKGQSDQLSIFDQLLPTTQDKITKLGKSAEWINEKGIGLKLTKGEHKLLICISKLLHKKSQHTDKTRSDYFTGNVDPNIVAPRETYREGTDLRFDKRNRRTASLALTLYEITKEYKGGETPSGRDVQNVLGMLMPLANDPDKRALIKYTRETKDPSARGGRIVDEIEGFETLLDIFTTNRKIYNENDVLTSTRSEVIIYLNPIFRDQIESKYIEYPDDFIKRIIDANKSHNISEVTFRLIDFLAHARSNKPKDGKTEVYEEKLYYKLAEDWMKDPKRGKSFIKKAVDKAIEVSVSIGLLLGFERTAGATGSPKYIFSLNANWT
ncbi:hypothetical protein GCM10027347_61450 [Larkinella harenae]